MVREAYASRSSIRVFQRTYTSLPSTNAFVSASAARIDNPTVAGLHQLYSASRLQLSYRGHNLQTIRSYAKMGGLNPKGISSPASISAFGGRQLKPYMQSPMVIAEPYKPPPKFAATMLISLDWWKSRGTVVMGWVKSMYCMAKCTKHIKGFSVNSFKEAAGLLYKDINQLQASASQPELRQLVTEVIYTQMKREIKQRETGGWASVSWELVKLDKMDIVQSRLVAPNQTDLDNAFVQFTVHYKSQQRFAAHNSKGKVVAGDPERVMNVEDYWVLERALSQAHSKWRLAGRISV
eukprot:CAMPEP_0118930686 /NCGR_PEP_ID=MMETSP1169-20130426/7285_1 /TAXON_ID=36882 /ORGANISM="Pyramimonas obovata, Strain CCMP722" /LENGTH=293 /DNA_ID=CAMNT_0006873075 /DNA_START=149 /DNA_END=1030 /DNA_ORIENTATION=+